MKISFSTQDHSLFVQLPIVPDGLTWGNGMNNQTFETIQHGEIIVPGTRKLISFTIDSFFPRSDGKETYYKFANSYYTGEGLAYQFNEWKEKSVPLRCVITSKAGRTLLNILVLIDNFERGMDRVSDIPYKLEVTEYRG